MLISAYIKQPSDWYFVSLNQVYEEGGGGLIRHYAGSLRQALQAVYPQYSWNSWKFTLPPDVNAKFKISKVQHLLFKYVQRVSNNQLTIWTYQC